jgi:hypothetical protein
MRMGRPGPGLGPGPVASRPICKATGRPKFPEAFGLAGPMGTLGPTQKYFFLICNHTLKQVVGHTSFAFVQYFWSTAKTHHFCLPISVTDSRFKVPSARQ